MYRTIYIKWRVQLARAQQVTASWTHWWPLLFSTLLRLLLFAHIGTPIVFYVRGKQSIYFKRRHTNKLLKSTFLRLALIQSNRIRSDRLYCATHLVIELTIESNLPNDFLFFPWHFFNCSKMFPLPIQLLFAFALDHLLISNIEFNGTTATIQILKQYHFLCSSPCA